MTERYLIAKESILEGCLVTPDVYKGVLERFDKFVTLFAEHLNVRTQRQKATDYMKGLISDTERKNVESIALFCRRRTDIAVMARIGNPFRSLADRSIGMTKSSLTDLPKESSEKSERKMP